MADIIHETTVRELHLYFSQLELEEVRAGGSYEHSREKLGVWFHLERRENSSELETGLNRKYTSNA